MEGLTRLLAVAAIVILLALAFVAGADDGDYAAERTAQVQAQEAARTERVQAIEAARTERQALIELMRTERQAEREASFRMAMLVVVVLVVVGGIVIVAVLLMRRTPQRTAPLPSPPRTLVEVAAHYPAHWLEWNEVEQAWTLVDDGGRYLLEQDARRLIDRRIAAR
jgi:hypothetical protein